MQVRLSDAERAAFDRAASLAGLSVGEWLRVAGLTAAGEGELLAQLRRLEPSLVEWLGAQLRRRMAESRQGALTPKWTHGPRRGCPVEELVTEPITYVSAVLALVLPAAPLSAPDEVWPPRKGEPRTRLADLPQYLPRDFMRDRETRLAEIVGGLLEPGIGLDVRRAWAFEKGYTMDAAVATNAMDNREPTKPHAYAVLRPTGRIETGLELRDGRELYLGSFDDLVSSLARQLRLLDSLGVAWPIAIGISLFGVKGRQLRGPGVDDPLRYVVGSPLPTDEIVLPIVEIAGPEVDLRVALRPPLDALWQEGGLRECHLLRRD